MTCRMKGVGVFFCTSVFLLALLCPAPISYADTHASLSSGDWATPGTWSPAGPPVAGDIANINVNGTTVTIATGGAAYAASINLATTAGYVCNFDMTNGTLTTTGTEIIGQAGTSTFTQNQSLGNTTHTAATIYLGYNAGSSGTYTLSAGTLNATNLYLGYSTNNSTSVFNLNGGTFKGGITDNSTNGAFNFNSGTLNINNTFNFAKGTFTAATGTTTNFLADATYNITGNTTAGALAFKDVTFNRSAGASVYTLTLYNKFTAENLTVSNTGSATSYSAVGSGSPVITLNQNLSISGSNALTFGSATPASNITVDLKGDVTLNNANANLATNLTFSDTTKNQTLTNTAGNLTGGLWTINKPGYSLLLSGFGSGLPNLQGLKITDGTFDTSNITSNGITLAGGTGITNAFEQAGGTFNMPVGGLAIKGAVLRTGGTFSNPLNYATTFWADTASFGITGLGANFGNTTFNRTVGNTGTRVFTFNDDFTVNDLTVNNGSTVAYSISPSGTRTLTANGNMSFTGANPVTFGSTSLDVNLYGNLSIASPVTLGSDINFIDGTKNQTVTQSAGTLTGTWTVNKANGYAVTQLSNVTGSQGLTLTNGTWDKDVYSLEIGAYNQAAGTTFDMGSAGALKVKGNFTSASAATFDNPNNLLTTFEVPGATTNTITANGLDLNGKAIITRIGASTSNLLLAPNGSNYSIRVDDLDINNPVSATFNIYSSAIVTPIPIIRVDGNLTFGSYANITSVGHATAAQNLAFELAGDLSLQNTNASSLWHANMFFKDGNAQKITQGSSVPAAQMTSNSTWTIDKSASSVNFGSNFTGAQAVVVKSGDLTIDNPSSYTAKIGSFTLQDTGTFNSAGTSNGILDVTRFTQQAGSGTGGTFYVPDGGLTVRGNFEKTAGTFTKSTNVNSYTKFIADSSFYIKNNSTDLGNVKFDKLAATNNTLTLWNSFSADKLIFTNTMTTGANYIVSANAASYPTVTVNGNFDAPLVSGTNPLTLGTIIGGASTTNFKFDLHGNLSLTDPNTTVYSNFDFTDATTPQDQIVDQAGGAGSVVTGTGSAGASYTGIWTVNKTDPTTNSVKFASAFSGTPTLQLTNGTIDTQGYNVSIGKYAQTGGTFASASTGVFTAKGITSVNDAFSQTGGTFNVPGGGLTVVDGSFTRASGADFYNPYHAATTFQANAVSPTVTANGLNFDGDVLFSRGSSGPTLNTIVAGASGFTTKNLTLNNIYTGSTIIYGTSNPVITVLDNMGLTGTTALTVGSVTPANNIKFDLHGNLVLSNSLAVPVLYANIDFTDASSLQDQTITQSGGVIPSNGTWTIDKTAAANNSVNFGSAVTGSQAVTLNNGNLKIDNASPYTVKVGAYTQTGGTFNDSVTNDTGKLEVANFDQTGGTFNVPGGGLTVINGNFTKASGAGINFYNPNHAATTFQINAASPTLTANGLNFDGDVYIDRISASGSRTFTIAGASGFTARDLTVNYNYAATTAILGTSIPVVTVLGNMGLTGNAALTVGSVTPASNIKFDLRGNLALSNSAAMPTMYANIDFTDASTLQDQTITQSGGIIASTGTWTVDKTAAADNSVNFGSAITGSQAVTLKNGNLKIDSASPYTVKVGAYTQTGGTFNDSVTNDTGKLEVASFAQNTGGGTFNMPSGGLTVNGSFTRSAGVFDNPNGYSTKFVATNSATNTITAGTTTGGANLNFGNLTFDRSAGTNASTYITLATNSFNANNLTVQNTGSTTAYTVQGSSAPTITALGNMLLTGSNPFVFGLSGSNFTVDLKGDWTMDGAATSNANINFSDDSSTDGRNQTITKTAGTIGGGTWTVNKSKTNNQVKQTSAVTGSQALTLTNGAWDKDAYSLEIGAYNQAAGTAFDMGSAGTLKVKGNFNVASGATFDNPNNLTTTFEIISSGANTVTGNGLDLNGKAIFNKTAGSNPVLSLVPNGANPALSVKGLDINNTGGGNYYITTPSNGPAIVGVNGDLNLSTTNQVTVGSATAANNVTFDLTGNLSLNGTVFSIMHANMNFTDDGTPHDQTVTFTSGTINTGTWRENKAGVVQQSGALNLASGAKLYIDNGTWFTNGSNLTVASTFSNTGILRVKGNETLTFANKDTDSGIVEYVGDGSNTTYSSLNYGPTFYDLKINSTSGTNTFNPNTPTTVNHDLNLLSGTLLLTSAGNLSVAGNITNGTGTGTLNVDGGTLGVTGSSIDVDNFNVGNAAAGTFTLGSGKTLTATNESVGNYTTTASTFTQTGGANNVGALTLGKGTYNLQGGTLDAGTIDKGVDATFSATGGRLSVGTFTGALTIGSGATLAPGNSPGETIVNGNFTNSGTIEFELGGTGGTPGQYYDTVTVNSGNVALGGVLQLKPWNGYTPTLGSVFDLITWTNGYTFTDNGYTLDASAFTGLIGIFTTSVVGDSLQLSYNELLGFDWNSADGSWAVASNWSGSTVPTSSDDAVVDNAGIANITSSTAAEANLLTIGDGTVILETGGTLDVGEIVNETGTGVLTVDGGALTSTGTIAADTLNYNSGTIDYSDIDVGVANINNAFSISSAKSVAAGAMNLEAVLTQSGGTNSVANALTIGAGTYALNNGSLDVGSVVNGAGTGVLTVAGGTLTSTGEIAADTLNYNSGTINYSSIDVGTANINNAFTISSGKSVAAGAMNLEAVLTQSGGTNTVTGALTIGAGTYALNNGSLETGSIANTTGTGVLTVAGGTLTSSGTIAADTLNYNSGTINYSDINVGTANINNAFAISSGKSVAAGAMNLEAVLTQSGGTNAVTNALTIGSGTYALNSGSLDTGSIVNGTGVSTFNVDGGTLTLTGSSANVDNFNVGNTAAGTFTIATGKSITATNEYLGNYQTSASNLTQIGTNTVSGTLTIGNATYDLEGGTLTVGLIANGAGTGTLNVDGGTLSLSGSSMDLDHFNVGNGLGTNGLFTLETAKSLAAIAEHIGNQGTGTVTQNGGTHMVTQDITLGNATYNLNGGSLTVGGNIAKSSGTSNLTIDGGTLVVGSGGTGSISVSNMTIGSNGSYEQKGQVTVDTALVVDGGTYQQTSGQASLGTMTVASGGTYKYEGGTLVGSGANTINAGSTFEGKGVVGRTGSFTNNGIVRANGGVLDLSGVGSIGHTVTNTGTNGWYATNGGELNLKNISIETGTSTYYWGDTSAMGSNLVNSMKLTFTGLTAGDDLQIRLLAPDNAEMVALGVIPNKTIGVFDIVPVNGTLQFTSVDIDITYDEERLNDLGILTSDLGFYHYYFGFGWRKELTTIDVVNKLLSIQNMNSFSPGALTNGKPDVPEIPMGFMIPLLALLGGGMIYFKKRIFKAKAKVKK